MVAPERLVDRRVRAEGLVLAAEAHMRTGAARAPASEVEAAAE